MDIDAVITWVDGDDPAHAERRSAYLEHNHHPASVAPTRFASRDELRYCAASLLKFCPFIRKIYVVVDGQKPWPVESIFRENEAFRRKIQVVDHSLLYGEHADLLPVFSSRSIETMLHRIPDLSEHFVYLNDDMFIGREVGQEFFFKSSLPVLRGTYKSTSAIVRRLKMAFSRGPKRAGFKEAQRKAAETLGFQKRYFLTDHLPYPMRRSTLEKHFRAKQNDLRGQAGHRFRSNDQMSPIGLANHLELLGGAAYEDSTRAGYLKPTKTLRGWQNSLTVLERLTCGELDAVCIQSLDQFEDDDRMAVISCLNAYFQLT